MKLSAREFERSSSKPSKLRRLAAAASFLSGIGFGLPGVIGAWHLMKTGDVWVFLGFPTYGEGPFRRVGLQTSVPLLSAFVAVCAAEVALGWLIWRRQRSARALSIALLPVELIFWIGFALPFGPPLGLGRVVLLAAESRSEGLDNEKA